MPLGASYEGKTWKIYYFEIGEFERELPEFLKFLDSIDTAQEKVVSIVPNTGAVKATILLSTGFTGVKGYAVITKKRIANPDSDIRAVVAPKQKGLQTCLDCGRTFTRDYRSCPYCGSSSLET